MKTGTTKLPLSAVVITHNEEDNIERCLTSLAFCDEIIVVDSKSTDRTRAIAERFTSRVYVEEWKGYSAQKNLADARASHDWILSVDADEFVSEELETELRSRWQAISLGPETAFSIPRKTVHLGRWIRHGGWYPNRLVRLFRRSGGRWVGDELHERWECRGEGASGVLEHALVHHSFRDLSDQVARNNHYSSLGALRLFRQGQRFSLLKMGLKTSSKFVETYWVKLGFLDGYPGFIISVSAAYSVFLKWAKLWELQQDHEKKNR